MWISTDKFFLCLSHYEFNFFDFQPKVSDNTKLLSLLFCTNFFFKGLFFFCLIFKFQFPVCLFLFSLFLDISQSLIANHCQKLQSMENIKLDLEMNISLLSGSGHLSTVIILCKSLKIIELLGKNLLSLCLQSHTKQWAGTGLIRLKPRQKVTQNACLSNFKEAQGEEIKPYSDYWAW